ncbi:MAG: ABC transporter ATP-binding protein [Eisenbergiella massiliensis]
MKGEIDFDHVYFKIQQRCEGICLSDITLHMKAGQTIGIIGRTGAAKSTLVQLIPRLYDVNGGDPHRRASGAGISAEASAGCHSWCSENTLFSGTVRDNLRWGKEDATEEEIEEACRTACVDEFIERLENGYDTDLGQGGVNVSGGQKQRLCIARALLKKPRVLILDDSTSAVDTATEAKIREGMERSLPGTTKIIIAQRITSVVHADEIIILEDGRVHAVGTHEELLKNNEIYQEIYQSQQEGADL